MRILLQRVQQAEVIINKKVSRNIGVGLVLFLGIESTDTKDDAQWLAAKVAKLRIFDDQKGIMNNSLVNIKGQALVISQFTLFAKTKKGNRPSYIHAAPPEYSKPLYLQFIEYLSHEINSTIITGEFGAYMEISLVNDGPVSIWIDTKNKE